MKQTACASMPNIILGNFSTTSFWAQLPRITNVCTYFLRWKRLPDQLSQLLITKLLCWRNNETMGCWEIWTSCGKPQTSTYCIIMCMSVVYTIFHNHNLWLQPSYTVVPVNKIYCNNLLSKVSIKNLKKICWISLWEIKLLQQ